ncbi:LysE family translocator [Celerinatantimonas sp. MCCC 1A17872]|uniref:LysE family translocator n=1 Tax=Celerinatantimonas sp. MCCC 1A17872 TaxID=3177514 RepID=UPI0038C5672D
MNEMLAVMTITIVAVISPGPDFAMITRASYVNGRKTGLLAALGIACGVQFHVFYTLFGVALIMAHSPLMMSIMKYVGAAYLIYLGISALCQKQESSQQTANTDKVRNFAAFKMGLFTNALNPKTMLFVIATFSQVMTQHSSISRGLSYGLFMSFAHWMWFSLVAVFFTSKKIRSQILSHQLIADRIVGVVLMSLGMLLAVSHMSTTAA